MQNNIEPKVCDTLKYTYAEIVINEGKMPLPLGPNFTLNLNYSHKHSYS
jgi:hypothetical protein